jgi:hypothetical protein
MSLDGGRGRLYAALKTLEARWDSTEPHWRDVMKVQFVEQILTPLQDQTADALQAITQMDVILHQMRRDCGSNTFDLYGSD